MMEIPQHLASQCSDVQLRMLRIQHPANKQQEYFKTFRKLKESEVFTDVTFVAQNGRSLSVHRLVLASYSQLLKEMMEDKIIGNAINFDFMTVLITKQKANLLIVAKNHENNS